MNYSSKELATTYFEEIESKEVGNKTVTTFKCRCGTKRSQDLKKGYVNLVSHIKNQHLDWQEIMNAKKKITDNQNPFLNRKAGTYFSWLEWIILDNLSFTFVERPLTRKNTKLEAIGVVSLMKYLKQLTVEVERKVSSLLPNKFGIVLDGWSEGTTHYIALFACCSTQMFLLSIAPPLDEEHFDSASHVAFIKDVLSFFGKSLDNVSFVVGDNAPVNLRISDLIGIPFIGCASHRFNLACKKYLQPFEDNLQRINSLMVILRNLKQAGKLRTKTHLEPVKRNVTRWSSTFAMLKRFFELKPFLDESDEELAQHIPSGREMIELQKLLDDMAQFESITKKLQESTISLSDVRSLFDTVIESYPTMNYYLADDAQIVHCPEFESGIVTLIDGNVDELSETQINQLKVFDTAVINLAEEETPCKNLAEQAMRNKRRKVSTARDHHYINLEFIPPTSNVVERLFSSARLVLTDYRKSMTPYTFECVMFLKFNATMWDINTVSKIVGK